MNRRYPDEPIAPPESPPVAFTDREGRDVEIRAYDADVEALVDMYVDYDPADRAQGIPPSGEESIRQWLDSILAEECVNVVAWHGDRAVGHAMLVPDRQGTYELAIFVQNEHQEAGIGTRLMEALLGRGHEEGVDRVWLTVERWNAAAINLYEKLGFEASDPEGFELEMAARLGSD
jgi:RimJ/RimL family protein N-acetyltransferase